MCKPLKIKALDGQFYTTDALSKEGIFRLLMSIPSPTAEPFKTMLAGIGKQAIAETEDPELGFGRLPTIKKATVYRDAPNVLTAPDVYPSLATEWLQHGVEEDAFWLLYATIMQWTFGLSLAKHKALKGLKEENLCDHMTPLELIFTALGEEVTRYFILEDDAQGFIENVGAAQKGGSIAGKARQSFEKKSGLKVISQENFLGLKSGESPE